MEALKKEVEELEKQLQGILERVDKRGAPTIKEQAEILRLFKEWQAKSAILRGVPKEEAYRQAEQATLLLGESMDILVSK
jgi:hypothetical protein